MCADWTRLEDKQLFAYGSLLFFKLQAMLLYCVCAENTVIKVQNT